MYIHFCFVNLGEDKVEERHGLRICDEEDEPLSGALLDALNGVYEFGTLGLAEAGSAQCPLH